jgi:putative transposase
LVRRVYRYRLYPTPAQDRALRGTLDLLRELYNAALQERRDAYRATGKAPTCYDQQKSLIEVRQLRPEFAAVHTHLLQDALTRLDRAFQAFFRRCKAGETPGYPRFKGRDRYHTFTFKDAANGNGAKLCAGGKRLRLSGIGHVKIKLHRPYEGRIKQVSVTLDGDGHWYAALVCDDVPPKPLPATGRDVGVDVGLATFAALSDGGRVENPRPLETARVAVLRAQRAVARKRRGSKRRRKAVRLLARQHARVRNSRKDFHHKTARDLVRRYDRIAVEDLPVQGLAGGRLARPVHDAAWAQFTTILAAKAEEAGRELVKVDPRGTSQTCSDCGTEVRKALAVRVHRCPHCGYTADRDHNAARNLHRLGHSRRGGALNAAADDPRSPRLAR